MRSPSNDPPPPPRSALRSALPEVELPPGSLALADLHIEASSPAAAETFVALCARLAGIPRLLILGDLFDAWVGPAHLSLPGAREVARALADLARAGTSVEVVHGNRDFLLDGSFEEASRARVHPHGLLGRVPQSSERILFVHGDELCTRDVGYQRLRLFLRSRPVVGAARLLPLRTALFAARRLRRATVRALDQKLPAAKAMQESAARLLMARHGARTLVCGHAHRARDEELAGGLRWLVLDAFGGPLDALRIGESGRGTLCPAQDLPPARAEG